MDRANSRRSRAVCWWCRDGCSSNLIFHTQKGRRENSPPFNFCWMLRFAQNNPPFSRPTLAMKPIYGLRFFAVFLTAFFLTLVLLDVGLAALPFPTLITAVLLLL